jgi:hypothetical protein
MRAMQAGGCALCVRRGRPIIRSAIWIGCVRLAALVIRAGECVCGLSNKQIAWFDLQCRANPVKRIKIDACRTTGKECMRRVVGDACTFG